MDKLTVYIWKSILTAIMLVLMLLVGIEFIFAMVNEIRYVGTGDYTTMRALLFVALTLPQQIAQLFPMATLVGTILGLGLLASRSELIVMQQAGLSVLDITIAVMKLALILSLIALLLSEFIAPQSEKMGNTMRATSLSEGQALRTANGIWMRNDNEFVHIQAIQPNNRLDKITRYQFDEAGHLKQASFAQYAAYSEGHWILFDLQNTFFGDSETRSESVNEATWNTHLSPEIIDVVGVKDLTELSIVDLWQTLRFRSQNHLDISAYQLAFWQKIVRPLSTLLMMFLAIPFVFGPLRSATMALRMLVGILLGFSFFTINQLFGPLTLVYHLPPLLGASLPLLLFMALGIKLQKKLGFSH